MSVSVSLAVMHSAFNEHRREMLSAMLAQLTAEGLPAQFSVHASQTRERNLWLISKPGLQDGLMSGATHHALIQDDLALCRNFVATLSAMAEAVPDQVICFYCPRKVVLEVLKAGYRWLVLPDGVWGQGYMMPVRLLVEFLEWEEQHIDPSCRWDDARVNMWLEKTGRPAWVCVPSIVQHLAPTDSMCGVNMPTKVAQVFHGDDGLALNWADTRTQSARGSLARDYFTRWYIE